MRAVVSVGNMKTGPDPVCSFQHCANEDAFSVGDSLFYPIAPSDWYPLQLLDFDSSPIKRAHSLAVDSILRTLPATWTVEMLIRRSKSDRRTCLWRKEPLHSLSDHPWYGNSLLESAFYGSISRLVSSVSRNRAHPRTSVIMLDTTVFL